MSVLFHGRVLLGLEENIILTRDKAAPYEKSQGHTLFVKLNDLKEPVKENELGEGPWIAMS